MEYEAVVIGSGLSGSILARKIAQEKDKKVLLLERRRHIGGNVYDEIDPYGIRIQRYGPHTFHTNKKEIYEYIESFVKLLPYRITCSANIDGMLTPSPFNFTTIRQFYKESDAVRLIERLQSYYQEEAVPITELMKSEDSLIKEYAMFLFEKDYRLYTAKQWGVPAEEIDPSVLKRVPVLLSYRDYIYDEKYEALPKDGFTNLIDRILKHKNIQVELNTNALARVSFDLEHKRIRYMGKEVPVIFTGAIDELFSYRYGRLPYRSLEFRYEYYEQEEVQKTTLVVHPQHKEYTRSTEYTKLPPQRIKNKSVVAYEYPCEYKKEDERGNEPYYPILTETNKRIFLKYKSYAEQFTNLTLCGRLADYKYYNMDQAIEHALEVFEQIKV